MPNVYFCLAPCVACGSLISFHPDRVPSLRVNAQGHPDPTGSRQPVCRTCWDRRQANRRQNNLPEETLLPGAYDPVTDGGDTDAD